MEAIGPDAAHRLNRLPDDNTRKLRVHCWTSENVLLTQCFTPDLNVNGTTVFGRYVRILFPNTTLVSWPLVDFAVCRMVADLMTASFPLQLPIIPNPALTFNITNGIPSF